MAKRGLILISLWLLAPVLAWGQALPRFEECVRFEWEYDPPPPGEKTEASLAAFRLYVSRTSGQYAFGKMAHEAPGGYVASEPSFLQLTLVAPCASVILFEPGTYYAVATAASAAGHESKRSNEVSFTIGETSPKTPIQPVGGGTAAQPVTLPEPPKRAGGGSSLPEGSRPKMPQGGSGGGSFSQHCLWRGTC